jgi:hypothetical protein
MPGSMGEFDQVAIDRVLDQELRFAVVHGQRPESVHGRLLTAWERQRVITFASVERLTIAIDACDWIGRFRGIVAVDPGLTETGNYWTRGSLILNVAPP